MPHIPDDLPNAEIEVLAFVRQQGSATTRQVSEGLAPHRKMGTSAAQALLLRLEAKSLLQRERIKGTKAFRYVPTQQAEPAYRRITRRLVDRIFGGSPVQLMSCLFDSREPTAKEIEQMKKLLKELKK